MKESFANNRSAGRDASLDNNNFEDDPFEESQQTQSQIEFTQLTQPGLTPDESSNMIPNLSSNHTPLSPPSIIPFGRLVPCVPSAKLSAIDLMPTHEYYWLGRSHKCDVTAQYSPIIGKAFSKTEIASLEWAKSMISNRHCRIFHQTNGNQILIEDNSGNGTFINQITQLRKGETRILHSGDEICLINTETLRKKIPSYRVIQMILQQFSFIVVQLKPRKSCVNPRAMNYNFATRSHNSVSKNERQTPCDLETTLVRRIENFYDMKEILGDGTSGQVRRAIHRQSGEERAVKIISLRRHVDISTMEREVELLQSLDHPYIVTLIDVFVRSGVAMYLVMELVKGGDLFDSIVEKQRYTAVEARRTMRRLLSAVHYLHHESNIVHRDLKPENILCLSPTDVKLADFGLAKIVKADGLKTFCGTPAYFAPEVLRRRHTVTGQGRYGKPADMWSLGVILYILLTGKPPFDPDTEECSKPFEVDFDLDGNVWSNLQPAKDLVQNMLCLDPQRRITVREACDHCWINMDDGDTHCHPLDDPAIIRNKDNLHQDSVVNEFFDNNVDTGVVPQVKFENMGMQYSEGSSLCSESEKHCRNVCMVSTEDIEILETKEPEGYSPPSTFNIKSSYQLTSKNEKNPSCTKNSSKNSKEDMMHQTKNDHVPNISSSDCFCVSPRSPLTKLNLNQRSNSFRDQIVKEANSSQLSSSRSERIGSPKCDEEREFSVTLTSNNTEATRELFDADTNRVDEKIEDPILSQFSSVISSIESFSDSSTNDNPSADQSCHKSVSKKRLPEEGVTKFPGKSPKRFKVCSSKQTTLKSWLVKKG